jgi:hypothetical protein
MYSCVYQNKRVKAERAKGNVLQFRRARSFRSQLHSQLPPQSFGPFVQRGERRV